MAEQLRCEICSCKRHGRLVLTGTHWSLEFCSRDMAISVVRLGANDEWQPIAPENLSSVIADIQASALPALVTDVDPAFLFAAFKLNVQIRNGVIPDCNAQIRHDTLAASSVTAEEVPVDFVAAIQHNVTEALRAN